MVGTLVGSSLVTLWVQDTHCTLQAVLAAFRILDEVHFLVQWHLDSSQNSLLLVEEHEYELWVVVDGDDLHGQSVLGLVHLA